MKFKCLCCGECCSRISDDSSGLPLFEWEVEKIRQLAGEKNIKINIEPIDCVLDKKSGLYFCTGYVLKSEPCVFLKDNKCSIHRDRPVICRAFPVARSPEFLDEIPDLSCFSSCPNFDFKAFLEKSLGLEDGKPFSLTKEKIIEKYSETFDEETMNSASTRDNALSNIDETIAILIENGLVDIEVVNDKNIKPISFSEFLKKINFS